MRLWINEIKKSFINALSNLVFTFERLKGTAGGTRAAISALGSAFLGPAGIIIGVSTALNLLSPFIEKLFGFLISTIPGVVVMLLVYFLWCKEKTLGVILIILGSIMAFFFYWKNQQLNQQGSIHKDNG